jgi:hypothetical protein
MPETNGSGAGAGTPAVITVSPINDTIATFIRLQGPDLSEKQMYVPTDTVLANGTKVKIEYRVQSFGQKSNVKIIDALAEVSEPSIDTSKGRHGVIVRFMKLSPNSLTLIQKVLEKKRQVSARAGTTPDSARPITAQIQMPQVQQYRPSAPPQQQTIDSTPPGMFGEATVVVPIEKLAKLARAGEPVRGVPPVPPREAAPIPKWEPPPAPVQPPVQKDKVVEPLNFFTHQEEQQPEPRIEPETAAQAEPEPRIPEAPRPPQLHIPAFPPEEAPAVPPAPGPGTEMNLDLLAAAQEASGGAPEEESAPLFDTLPQAEPGYAEMSSEKPGAAAAPAESPFMPSITQYQQADNRKILEFVKSKTKKHEEKKAEGKKRTYITAILIIGIVLVWIYTIKVNFFPSYETYAAPPPPAEAAPANPEQQASPASAPSEPAVEKAPEEVKAKGPELLPVTPRTPSGGMSKKTAAAQPPAKKVESRPPAFDQIPPPTRRSEEPVMTGGPGSLIISSAPLGDIFFDGQPMGRPPVEIKSTPAGKHRIEVRKDGFRSEERTVVVRPGAREAVFIKLTPVAK